MRSAHNFQKLLATFWSFAWFDSVSGFRNYSMWRFAREGTDRTRIEVVFTYELPGGLAGKALGKMIEPIVKPAVKHSDAELRRLVAEDWKASKQ